MGQLLYTFEYDRSYLPPFPVMEVKITRFGDTQDGILLNVLIDSGSDGTMTPLSILKQIHARKIGRTYIVTINGARQQVDVFEVAVQIAGQHMGRVEVVADRHNRQMILGRDLLNHFVITLNGLANLVEIPM